MLTQDQLIKLEPLTNHPKFGIILKAAINGWKKCKPVFDTFGLKVSANEKQKFLRDRDFKGCCFLGASLLGKQRINKDWVIGNIVEKFKISEDEAWSLSDGFEKWSLYETIDNKDAFIFGKKVRKALGKIEEG